jgi:hypothetical protein
MVPALKSAADRAGINAPAIAGLAELGEGRIEPKHWLDSARKPARITKAA